jgi:hypothetical protein
MGALRAETATKADLENVKRAAGHVPTLMSRLDAIEKAGKQAPVDPRVDALLERFEAFLEAASPLLPEDATARIKAKPAALTQADIDKAVTDRLAAVAAEEDAKAKTPEVNPEILRESAIADAQWASAETAVRAYAEKTGVDFTHLPPEIGRKIQLATFDDAHPFGDPMAGAKALMIEIDKIKAVETRRAGRVDAGSGGIPANRGAAQGGALTLAAMAEMTAEQLMKIPRAERDAALKAGV